MQFNVVTGEILGSNKFSETHVSSSGGGGYVGRDGGHIRAPQVSSSTTTNHEFWIKTEEGKEKSIQLKGYDIAIREGQKISIITATTPQSKSSYYCSLINHNAQNFSRIASGLDLNTNLKIKPLTGLSFWLATASAIGIYFWKDAQRYVSFGETFLWTVGAFFAVGIGSFLIRSSKRRQTVRDIDDHINELSRSLLEPQTK